MNPPPLQLLKQLSFTFESATDEATINTVPWWPPTENNNVRRTSDHANTVVDTDTISFPFIAPCVENTQVASTRIYQGILKKITLFYQEIRYQIHYLLKRSKRRSIAFSISSYGLIVTAPQRVSVADIEKVLLEKTRWLTTKLKLWWHNQQQTKPSLAINQAMPYLGKPLLLLSHPDRDTMPSSALRFTEKGLMLAIEADADEAKITAVLKPWLHAQAMELFQNIANRVCTQMGIASPTIKINHAKTRWGSCSSNRVIRLHQHLIHYPLSVIEYVVTHECAHLIEMNHSRAFWSLVATYCPTYREAEALLKTQHPNNIPWSLVESRKDCLPYETTEAQRFNMPTLASFGALA